MLIIGPAEHLHNLISLSVVVKYICCVCVRLPSSLSAEQWHFLAECAIAFNKIHFKALCHTASNCTPKQYKSFHVHFFAFHSLHLILEALEATSFLAFMPAWRCKYNNAGAKMAKESEWETLNGEMVGGKQENEQRKRWKSTEKNYFLITLWTFSCKCWVSP